MISNGRSQSASWVWMMMMIIMIMMMMKMMTMILLMMNLPEPESHVNLLVDDIQWKNTECVVSLDDDDDYVDDELTRTREPRISSR